MSADEIREGGMVAKLKLGDPLAARKFWVMIGPSRLARPTHCGRFFCAPI